MASTWKDPHYQVAEIASGGAGKYTGVRDGYTGVGFKYTGVRNRCTGDPPGDSSTGRQSRVAPSLQRSNRREGGIMSSGINLDKVSREIMDLLSEVYA